MASKQARLRYLRLLVAILIAMPWWLVSKIALSGTSPSGGDVVAGVMIVTMSIVTIKTVGTARKGFQETSGERRVTGPTALTTGRGRGVAGTVAVLALGWSVYFGLTHPLLVPHPLTMWSVLSLTTLLATALRDVIASQSRG